MVFHQCSYEDNPPHTFSTIPLLRFQILKSIISSFSAKPVPVQEPVLGTLSPGKGAGLIRGAGKPFWLTHVFSSAGSAKAVAVVKALLSSTTSPQLQFMSVRVCVCPDCVFAGSKRSRASSEKHSRRVSDGAQPRVVAAESAAVLHNKHFLLRSPFPDWRRTHAPAAKGWEFNTIGRST